MDKKLLMGTAAMMADLRRTLGSKVTIAEAEILLRIAAAEGLSQRELGDRMKLPKSNIARYCDHLSEERRSHEGDLEPGHGFVEKTPDPEDRKRHMVSLTSKGARYVDRLQGLARPRRATT